jgi:hypothetical protein
MSSECVYPLDRDTLELFALKGTGGGFGAVQIGNGNGVKVRRVMQITSDFAKAPFDQLKIIDFACGEGVYAIEAALRGAEVLALDARTERMKGGIGAAERLGLSNLQFEQMDVRGVNVDSHGMADVVFFLGILYHLDFDDICFVLENIYNLCRGFVIIDTHVALRKQHSARHKGQTYEGLQVREHADDDSEDVRRSRLGGSWGNPLSFFLTKESLFRLLKNIGFTCVFECKVPLEPGKPDGRITIVATKGEPVKISSYPWVNEKTEDEIRSFLANLAPVPSPRGRTSRVTQLAKSLINGTLQRVGFEIRRI